MRDGAQQRVPATHLVPGDVICISMGDKIPADVLMLEVQDFKVRKTSARTSFSSLRAAVTLIYLYQFTGKQLCFDR